MLVAKDMEARSQRAAEAARDAGHHVLLICRPGEKKNVDAEFVTYRVEHVCGPRWLPQAWRRKATVPFPGNPIYLASIARAIGQFRPDVIHVHDLPLVLPALLVSAGHIPIIFDMHENYPAMVETWTKRSPLHRWIVRCGGYRLWERLAIRAAWHIVVVCDEQKQRVEAILESFGSNRRNVMDNTPERTGTDCSEITVVGNTPSRSLIDALQIQSVTHTTAALLPDSLRNIPDTVRIIFYSGILADVRGVDTVIDAMSILRNHHPNTVFVVAGDGAHLPHLQQHVRELGLASHVRLIGWQQQDVLMELTRRAEICVIPHRPCEHINTTYPNKIFEYMAAGKPLVVSQATPLMRIIHESVGGAAGLCADTPQEWAEALRMLLDNTTQARAMGQRGQMLVRDRYNAEMDAARLLSVYEKFQ